MRKWAKDTREQSNLKVNVNHALTEYCKMTVTVKPSLETNKMQAEWNREKERTSILRTRPQKETVVSVNKMDLLNRKGKSKNSLTVVCFFFKWLKVDVRFTASPTHPKVYKLRFVNFARKPLYLCSKHVLLLSSTKKQHKANVSKCWPILFHRVHYSTA